jgi:hypothetical protein
MKRCICWILFLLVGRGFVSARDVLILLDGTRRAGDIAEFDGNFIRLRVALPDAAGGANALVSIPRSDVEAIEFRENPIRSGLLKDSGVERLLDVELEWMRLRQWLAVPRSPAASVGCKFGELLLRNGSRDDMTKALGLFSEIESTAWSEADRMRAKQWRLRTMVASGNALEAVGEAKKIAEEFDDPLILIEANHIMAQATAQEMGDFLKENPRWSEDTREIDEVGTRVVDQFHILRRRALGLFLYPALFYGSDNEKAARGLWGAVGIHRLGGDDAKALEVARDIVAFYPATTEAHKAVDYLTSLTPEMLNRDAAKEAREEMLDAHSSESHVP